MVLINVPGFQQHLREGTTADPATGILDRNFVTVKQRLVSAMTAFLGFEMDPGIGTTRTAHWRRIESFGWPRSSIALRSGAIILRQPASRPHHELVGHANRCRSRFHAMGNYQRPNDATAANDDRVLQPGSTIQSEANILNEGLLGTQPLTCWAVPTAQLVGTNCVKNVVFYGAELVAAWGPFSIQGEYIGAHYNRDPNIIVWQGAPGAATVNFDGFYAYATWYLTGESRAEAYHTYEDFNAPGTFGQIHILNPWSAGGWGAWEVAARVSEINLNSGGFINPVLGTTFTASPVNSASNILNIQGGRQSDFTLGLNWYPDKGIRLMANWVNVFQYSAPYNRPDLNGIHPNFFILRAQVDW